MNTQAVVVSDEKKKKRAAGALIWLCWLVYTCSYLGKVNYSANVTQIMDFYNVDHSEAGLVGTFLFFSYGVGQFVNGFLCKKYNLKWIIFASLMVSGTVNLAVALTPDFAIVKYLWLINGFSLSVLWPCVIRMLSECLSKKYMARATVIVGTTVAAGTFAIYAASALFATFDAFKLAFYTAAVIMPLVAILWIFAIPRIMSNAKRLCYEDEEENTAPVAEESKKVSYGAGMKKALYLTVIVLAIYAVATNLIKDGLTSWMPAILKENYALDDSFSIVLSLSLPMMSMFGNFFAVSLNNRIPNFIMQCAVIFITAGAITAVVIGGLSWGQLIVTLIGFTLVCFLVSSSNSLITSIFPLFMKQRINSGMMAGVLNGCCYVGSTIASYGLGVVAENAGWSAVFWVLFSVCVLVCVIAVIYWIINRAIKKKYGFTDKNL